MFQIIITLHDCLFMGKNFSDIFLLHALFRKKTVINFQFDTFYDVEIVLHHQIIDLVHRSCRAVFNRQNSILAETFINGRENTVEVLHIHNLRHFEQSFTGLLRISAGHPLAGHCSPCREYLRSLFQSLFNGLHVRSLSLGNLSLMVFTHLHNCII